MEEATPNTTTATEETPVEQFGIEKIYVKDISFETPNSPQIFREEWKPNVEMEMYTSATALGENMYEVVINLTSTVKVADKTAFLVEIKQAGIFGLTGFPQDKLTYMLHAYCPNILFPYARETVSDLVVRGGFEQMLLMPISFDALYMQRLEQARQAAEAAQTPETQASPLN